MENIKTIPEGGSVEEAVSKGRYYTEHDSSLPNVLLLGDSISMGYHTTVVGLLRGKANVYRPIINYDRADNCADTNKGVENIHKWLGDKKWSVIHFNWGLHDLKRLDPQKGMESDDPSLPTLVDINKYQINLNSLVDTLKKTNARLIMATTTTYPNGVKPCRIPEDCVKYNKVALDIAYNNNIVVNDLFSFVKPRLNELQLDTNVHFTEYGSQQLGIEVARYVETELSKLNI